MSLFISGTDTGVGKTVSSAALMLRYDPVIRLKYFKPVQTGCPPDDDRLEVMRLTGLPEDRFYPVERSYQAPLSPHRAAELEGDEIRLQDLVEKTKRYMVEGPLLVEGAGGLLVPLNRRETWIDFLKTTGLPVLLVARTGLGTINHTLLSVNMLRQNRIPVAGLLFVGEENQDNLRTIENFSGVPVTGRIHLEASHMRDYESFSGSHAIPAMDPDEVLKRWLYSPT